MTATLRIGCALFVVIAHLVAALTPCPQSESLSRAGDARRLLESARLLAVTAGASRAHTHAAGDSHGKPTLDDVVSREAADTAVETIGALCHCGCADADSSLPGARLDPALPQSPSVQGVESDFAAFSPPLPLPVEPSRAPPEPVPLSA